jgi:hypothetical protein
MRLTLHYRGPLKANGNPTHKHSIRKGFHNQLRTLWMQQPLSEQRYLLESRQPQKPSLLRSLGAFVFAPLVAQELNAVAELKVILLRPEPPGHLLTQGGDIDNRLKTLFDALTMPRLMNALPKEEVAPSANESPFFCLLEDDNLVTSVSVRTEQLLEPDVDKTMVDATIFIRTRTTRSTFKNSDFA